MALGALDAALSGLRVTQQQLNTISSNVANVGTEGYTRKTLPQSTQAINGIAVAVRGETIIRNVDMTLTRDVWTQVSATSNLDKTLGYLRTIEDFHGPPDAELSFAAEIAELRDSFSILSDSPEDTFLLRSTVDQAIDTASKINDFADLLTTLRNDAQSDLQISVTRANDLLSTIAELNQQIKFQVTTGRSTAQLEDFRDQAVKELSEELEITFFTRGDGVLVVQTIEGQQLTDENAEELVFTPVPVSPANYYPDGGVSGLFLRGDPATVSGGFDLTQRPIGGNIGALLDLRDQTLPQYTAQIDEIAHKLARRFEAQGLMLYTDSSGNVPLDTPPTLDDPLTTADETVPVEYVGFASEIQVNTDIIADNSLLRSGTYGATVNSGSNEVIFRVLEHTFGNTDYEEAIGNISFLPANISVAGETIQSYLGIYSENTVAGNLDLSVYADVNALITAAGGALDPGSDTFRLVINGNNLDISMAAAQLQAGATATDRIVAEINAQITASPLTAAETFASVSASGQIVIESRYDITIDATAPANAMGQGGLNFLGLQEGTIAATDPYFEVQVGNDPAQRITIAPGDTEIELLAKLQAVSGLAVEDFTTSADGFLRLRPGNDYANPDFGGSLRITPGPFTTELTTDPNSTAPVEAGLATVFANEEQVNIVSALFGSYTDPTPAPGSGGDIVEADPVANIGYQSEVSDSSGTFVSFRNEYLGPYADVSTDLAGSTTLIDFGQKIVNKQIEAIVITEARFEDENTFKETLERQLLDESGVNLDEELSNLIIVQTAYSASARTLSAVEELFQELLNVFR